MLVASVAPFLLLPNLSRGDLPIRGAVLKIANDVDPKFGIVPNVLLLLCSGWLRGLMVPLKLSKIKCNRRYRCRRVSGRGRSGNLAEG